MIGQKYSGSVSVHPLKPTDADPDLQDSQKQASPGFLDEGEDRVLLLQEGIE
jgi:hypothetical protein